MRLHALSVLKRQKHKVLLSVSILLYTVVFSYIAISKHYAFMSTAWDLGIYEQVIWSTINTGRLFWYTPEVLINPSCSFFGVHFSPFLFLILPIYAVFQATETLLVLQTFFLALGAVPLYKLVLFENGSRKQAFAFALIYLFYPPLSGIALFDFHVQAFLPFLFFSAFYYLKKENWGRYLLFIFLSLMVIEFVPLIVSFFGLYGLWVSRKKVFHSIRMLNLKALFLDKRIFFPLITVILGVIWFMIAKRVILTVNPTAPPHPNWKDFGDPIHNLPDFAYNVLTNPVKTLEAIVTPIDRKAIYIFGLFAPLCFLSFLDLSSLAIGFPWFFVAFLSTFPPYQTPIGYQYVAFIVSFIFISAIYGVKRLFAARNRLLSKKRLSVITNKIKIPHRKSLFAIFLVFTITVSYIAILGINPRLPILTEHGQLLETFIKLIPSNASVLTQNDIFPHLSRRLYAYVVTSFSYPLPPDITYDYILIDTKSTWYEVPLENTVYNLTKNNTFGVQYAADGIWLLKRNYTGEIIYLIRNGTFVEFYNQGVSMKLFNDASLSDEPDYENVSFCLYGSSEVNIPKIWREKNFTLLFEGWLYTPISGNYLFELESIGSSKFYLDDKLFLNKNSTIAYNTTWLESGFHPVKVEYTKANYSVSFVQLLWKPPWNSCEIAIQPSFLYSSVSPDISSPFLDINWLSGSKSPFPLINQDHFSAFTNFSLYVPLSGTYKFQVLTNGYASMSIDGRLVLSPFVNDSQTAVEIFLNEGNHAVQIDYMKLQENAYLSVTWQTPESSQFEEIASDSYIGD